MLKNNGSFILRIDDTDLTRSSKEFENKIKENLSWLGLIGIKLLINLKELIYIIQI